jgi:hypothetical protein
MQFFKSSVIMEASPVMGERQQELDSIASLPPLRIGDACARRSEL